MNIGNVTVIVTGAASGFGYHLCRYLQNKVKKVIAIDIKKDLKEIYKDSIQVECRISDLTDYEQTTKVIRDIFMFAPDINVLINNAGLIHSELLINLFNKEDKRHSYYNWIKLLDINLTSVFNCTVNVAEKMIENRTKGLIINISSISARGNAGQSVYSAAKAGVSSLTAVWCKELSTFGIRVAGIAPGFFETPSTYKALKENIIQKIKKEIALKRFGQLDELAHAVKFIIENDYFNGKILELDGGMQL